MKDALDKAAASPDPAVRAMALSWKEMQAKMEAMTAFFNFYAEGMPSNGSGKASNGHAPSAAPRVRTPSAAKSQVKNVKADEFTKAILTILYASSEPVKLPDLQMAYEALGLEEPMEKESFRQRMHKRQKEGTVVLIPRVGFWPPEPTSAP